MEIVANKEKGSGFFDYSKVLAFWEKKNIVECSIG